MASTFFDRVDELSAAVGEHVSGKLVVDQVYAHYQHEGVDFKHPRGGQSHFLRDPLFAEYEALFARCAAGLLTPEGTRIVEAMGDAMEDLDAAMHRAAPVEHGNLQNSGHPTVYHDGALVHDRPPHVPRLSEAELRAEHRRAAAAAAGRQARRAHAAERRRPR